MASHTRSQVHTLTRSIKGTYRHDDCGIFCTDRATGALLPNLTCRQCARIPLEDDFRLRLQGRSDVVARDIRIDNLPTVPLIIDRARKATKRDRESRWTVVVARNELARSRCRERNLRERLEAGLVTGDLAGLVHDLKHCQVNGKFIGRQVMLTFFKDVVHDLRLQKPDGKHNPGMRWHESTKRLLGALRKWGGPRSHRLIRLNIGGASLRTVERVWNRDLFHYLPGVNEATFMQLASFCPTNRLLPLSAG